MNKWYALPVVFLIVAVPAYLFLFDEGYCPDIEEMADAKIQVIGASVFGSDADGCVPSYDASFDWVLSTR